MNLGAQMKQKFFAEGNVLPRCINPGCERPVMVRDWKNWSIKSECGTCYKARVTGFRGPAMSGIEIHKKEYCENVDGRLGWECPVPVKSWKELDMLNALDLEHLDGDHFNNTPENVDTICKLCHGKKSTINNDFSNTKESARRIVH
jgi:5-methylcytosine-specific restriction endonuclease McrA